MSNMKTIREKVGVTQAALAKTVGLTQGAIAHYENDRRKPGLEECRRIVDALNTSGAAVTLDDVFPPLNIPACSAA
ncbi:helix-turn-helix transcriptional regulator [Pseudomonas sp. TNT11]|jgi:putative transcriptional regulator|uniref:Helix-turn-helix transcriptional regulator n=1 Tax=Pseudomonas emilianonis TaxID=2915812 RepID=A0ABT0ECE2_9PSED|nr:helix-turn-helix transcriptional regulator [Pseudomonas emilianonis]MCK1783385.1 helix-turn-helix transcriptional regulator [Pseudomonas emilianonis]